VELIKRFYQGLRSNFEDGVAYIFLDNLRNGRFRFSLSEQKEMILVEALKKSWTLLWPLRSIRSQEMTKGEKGSEEF